MARPGMTRWRTRTSTAEGSDEVQRSLELLDRVLSEFDDLENGNVAAREEGRGQLSEDDGYMSMNGRRAKLVLELQLPPAPEPPPGPPPAELALADYPPPPEEAERIISTLLPRVSPGNSAKRIHSGGPGSRRGRGLVSSMTLGPHYGGLEDSRVTTATQTTLPKTRHQRPFGWENGPSQPPVQHCLPSVKFGSLPYDSSMQWLSQHPALPPRTCPSVIERHREVRRRTPEEENGQVEPLKTLVELADDDHANFSDDSLEELLPPPPTSKRGSIAWEVPLDLDDEALMTPGSTKVVGRRRRKSTDRSSTGSIPRLRDQDDWPDPPTGTEDGSLSPFSDWDSSAGKLDDGSFLPAELSASELSASGTYVIRKGRRKERAPVPVVTNKRTESKPRQPSPGELKRCSSTFDNIKSLLKEGLIEGLDETPPDFQPPTPPALARVVSLPTLTIDETCQTEPLQILENEEPRIPQEPTESTEEKKIMEEVKSCDVGIQVMDDLPQLNGFEKLKESVEESTQVSLEYREINYDKSSDLSKSCDSVVDSIDSKTEEALILKLQQDQSEDFSSSEDILSPTFGLCSKPLKSPVEVAKEEVLEDPWLTASEISEVQVVPVLEHAESKETSEKEQEVVKEEENEKRPNDFNVMVEVIQHEFGPLPPSPVEEDEDEYSDVLRNSPVKTRGKADTVPEPFYRCLDPPGSDPIGAKFLNRPCPDPPPHREPMSSLKTRSMDAGFSRNHKNQHSNSRRDIPSERRTLPTDLPGPSRRRTLQKRGSSQSPREETHTHTGHMQVSCSLPETPIFARGCDIPRTPHRRAPEIPPTPTGTRTTPRPPGVQTNSHRRTGLATGLGTGHSTTGSNVTLGQAMVGAELLRLTGGPGRGWYPRHRQPRPASVEHLDHLARGGTGTHPAALGPSARDRKPLTLPPNLTPKFFHRSPREALRRVTSLLIRKDESSPAPPVPPHMTSLHRYSKQGNSKDSKKDPLSPTQAFGTQGEEVKQKRGFFKSFWKRSRHYSLENQ